MCVTVIKGDYLLAYSGDCHQVTHISKALSLPSPSYYTTELKSTLDDSPYISATPIR